VKNPNPISRARRHEMRRKKLGCTNPRCFYCPESDIACLELDHPVGSKRDPKFKRAVCRNCHRKREMERDLAGLTKNGQHNTNESEVEELRSYLMLMAEDQDSIADALLSPAASPELIAAALQSTAASLRRRAKSLPQSSFTPTCETTSEWDGRGCA
jgi:hypothetical protein